MECYRFCQQREDHFDIAKTIGSNQILFAALFF